MGERELLLGARDAHIHQPPLFLQRACFHAIGMGKQPFLAANQIHKRILQAFGGVQGGHFHCVHFAVIAPFQQRHQRDGLREFNQVFLALFAFFCQPSCQILHIFPADFRRLAAFLRTC